MCCFFGDKMKPRVYYKILSYITYIYSLIKFDSLLSPEIRTVKPHCLKLMCGKILENRLIAKCSVVVIIDFDYSLDTSILEGFQVILGYRLRHYFSDYFPCSISSGEIVFRLRLTTTEKYVSLLCFRTPDELAMKTISKYKGHGKLGTMNKMSFSELLLFY